MRFDRSARGVLLPAREFVPRSVCEMFAATHLSGFGGGSVERTNSSSAQWNSGDGGYASYTFSGADLSAGNSKWIRTLHQFAGDFDVQFTTQILASGAQVFLYPVSADGSWTSLSGARVAGLGATALWCASWQASTTLQWEFNNSNEAAVTANPGDVLRLTRVGSTVTGYLNGVSSRVFTGTSNATVRLSIGSFGNNVDYRSISWLGGA